MYSIYSDGELIYAPNMVRSGYQVIAPKLKTEFEKVDVLTFQLPPGCRGYDIIKKRTSDVTVFDGDKPIFHGHCLDSQRGLLNTKSVKCEGARAWLRDSVMRPYTFDDDTISGSRNFWEKLLSNHNAQASANRAIVAGAFGNYSRCHRSSEDYVSTLETMEKFLAELIGGGHLVMRYEADANRNITTYADRKAIWAVTGQVIQFGKNLLDINEYLDTRNVYTVIIPVGKNGLTISGVNSGKDYLESEVGIKAWGRIWKVVYFRDITDASALKSAAQSALEDAIAEALTLKIRAIDLKRIGLSSYGLEMGSWHNVVSPPHGINSAYQLTRIETDMAQPERSIYEFGVSRKTLTQQITQGG